MNEPMKPGNDLDKQVAEIMGYGNFWQDRHTGLWYAHYPNHANVEDDKLPIPQFSTDGYAAWEAWEWLEKNNPWQPAETDPGDIYLSRYWLNSNPAVIVVRVAGAEIVDYRPSLPLGRYNFAIWGESYPHAIALAIVATRAAKE